MRHRMRCHRGQLGCGRRFTLRRDPKSYKRGVRCPHCRSEHVYSVERQRREEMERRRRAGRLCRCSAYPFPHEMATLRMCDHWAEPNVEPTAQEWEQFETCWKTPRGWAV